MTRKVEPQAMICPAICDPERQITARRILWPKIRLSRRIGDERRFGEGGAT